MICFFKIPLFLQSSLLVSLCYKESLAEVPMRSYCEYV